MSSKLILRSAGKEDEQDNFEDVAVVLPKEFAIFRALRAGTYEAVPRKAYLWKLRIWTCMGRYLTMLF